MAMPDRGEVIKGLERVSNDIVDGYITEPDMACNTINDAISLLKAQEPVEPVRRRRHGQIGYSCFCGMCGYGIGRNEKYCALCGRQAKWR